MTLQTLSQKRGEISFRQLLSTQHRGINNYFPDEYTKSEMLEELAKRIARTREDFARFKNRHLPISPFLEIGAEYAVRASLLVSDFAASGVAVDIATAPLLAAADFAREFKLKKLPLRVVADVHHLPFPDKSFPFVFCYQTLHHFPDPLPVIKEILRVLAPGGYFFFAEEPISQKLNLRLFRRPTKSHGIYKLFKIIPLLPFISQIGKTETDFGIFEGTFSLSLWETIIDQFLPVEAIVDTYPLGHLASFANHTNRTKPFLALSAWYILLLNLLGGGIQALLQKPTNGKNKQRYVTKIVFTCPDCLLPLHKKNAGLYCKKCQRHFLQKNGVFVLLPLSLHKTLYANI